MPLQLDNYSRTGLLYRWYIINGEPRCPYDPVDPKRIPLHVKNAILAQNEEVRNWQWPLVEVTVPAVMGEDLETGEPVEIEPEYKAMVPAELEPTELGPDPLADLPPYEPVPPSISRRQFFTELALQGVCSPEEAETAMVGGELPDAFASVLALLPEEERFLARMLLKGAAAFERTHPMVAVFAMAQNPPWPDALVDEFFRLAAKH